MKKVLFLLLMVAAFVACSDDDDDDKFNYDINTLIGKWRITEVESNGKWTDVTSPAAERVFEPTYATFYDNGKYYGEGELGDGTGTYKATGNTIICYVEGEEYMRCEVVSLTGNKCQLKIKVEGETVNVKCTKQTEEEE